jgi:hypothetical protein
MHRVLDWRFWLCQDWLEETFVGIERRERVFTEIGSFWEVVYFRERTKYPGSISIPDSGFLQLHHLFLSFASRKNDSCESFL